MSYRCKRGATLVVPLEAVGATDAALAGITIDAGLKRASYGNTVPNEGVARVVTFAPDARAAADGIGPGWNLSLTAAETFALEPGSYVTDAVLILPDGATRQISEPLVIVVEQAVSV